MICDMDKTLEKLLQLGWGTPLPFDLSFMVPGKEFTPVSESKPTLDCYLYDICENRELRSNERQFNRKGDGTVEKVLPPVRIKLSYCITAWSPAKAALGIDPPLDEHRLLSQVLAVLLKYPLLPPGVLQGQLVGQQFPIPTTVALPEGIKNPGDFWNAIGGQLRPSLDFSATIALDYRPAITAAEVRNKILAYLPGDETEEFSLSEVVPDAAVQIGGYIRDKHSPAVPIADAWVLIEEIGKAGKTGCGGEYRLGNLRQGTYTLSVRANGYRDAGKKITVPAAPKEYDILLIPD